MKINVLIPTRGRPLQLAAALYSLFFCASDKHELTFCVACDDDDDPTKNALRELRQSHLPIFVRVGPRPETLGSVANDLAAHWPADVYQVFADDLICITHGWDDILAQAVEKTPHGVFWMKSAKAQRSLVPAVTEKWRAAAGEIFTEYFPYWFDDLWLEELWVMATGEAPISLETLVVDRPASTHRMRELSFWARFYHALRSERLERGRRIASALNLPECSFASIIGKEFAKRMDSYPPLNEEDAAKIEASNKAETTPPSEQYLRVKAKAEELMKMKVAA